MYVQVSSLRDLWFEYSWISGISHIKRCGLWEIKRDRYWFWLRSTFNFPLCDIHDSDTRQNFKNFRYHGLSNVSGILLIEKIKVWNEIINKSQWFSLRNSLERDRFWFLLWYTYKYPVSDIYDSDTCEFQEFPIPFVVDCEFHIFNHKNKNPERN